MRATSGWRTTSSFLNWLKAIPRTSESTSIASLRPLFWPLGQVDLGDVAGDHGLGADADAGEEHLHLLGRRVLRFVEDDEGVVEGAAAHEGQRCDLDRALFVELGDAVLSPIRS